MAEFFDDYLPYYWKIQSRLYSDAVDDGFKLLREAKRLSDADYRKSHKGSRDAEKYNWT